MENLKQLVGIKAAEFVSDGMIVGLGTGSTAAFFVEELGRRVKEENLNIVGVTTSHDTTIQAKALGIPLKSIDEVTHVDVTIDGADEIDDDLNGIKGGGAALLMEKIVANYTKHYIWIVDDSKLSRKLGSFKVPVEVIPYGFKQLFRHFEKQGFKPSYRYDDKGDLLVTDMKHHIIDLHFDIIHEPEKLAKLLDETIGVVEHGLFNNMVDTVIVGSSNGVSIIDKKK